jgi:excisionase family DNA binding protein
MPNKDPTPPLPPEENLMERWWTVLQVADYLQVKPSTVYRWVNSGEIPFLRVGRLLRFKKSLLDNWTKN